MSTNVPNNQENQEIDLFSLFNKIGEFFQWINTLLFKCIRFFVKNAILISILLIIGFGIGFYIDKNRKVYDHQIIVAPNFKSTDYLYSKIDLIASKINEKDTLFLKSLGIQKPLEITKVSIEPIVDVYKFINNNEHNIELLELMAQNGDLKTIVKESTTSKNYNFHTIIISTTKKSTNNDFVEPVLNFLNRSTYFEEIQKISATNIQDKIKAKEEIVVQIDQIISEFSNKNLNSITSDKLIYYNENTQLNSLVNTKDSLVSQVGSLKIEQYNATKIINDNAVALNITNTKSINGKLKFILPLALLLFFISIKLFISFYRKQVILIEERA
ncbi:hypothetical protein [Flavobacterium sp. K5-23]|uniref:hypothetical protein n=1 Tax=Flavobacterium sp. K5-23 TaxID=2746225 RepID=UPI00200D2B68|nr:hypothetical protein [Flavobacterium sp. K5-23]UQD55568.1 hypothetical protein FLAK523_03830 [Flavobacterium sp. K5-23]